MSLTNYCEGNVPFNFLENPFFRQFIALMRPNAVALTRSKAVRTELPSLSIKTVAAVEKFIPQATHVTLLSDGWDRVASQQ